MKHIIFAVIVVCIAFLCVMVYRNFYTWLLPGNRRLNNELHGHEDTSGYSIGEKFELWVKQVLPPTWFEWIENMLYQTGQSFNWTVAKAVRAIFISFLIGISFLFINVLLFSSIDAENSYVFLVAGTLVFIGAPFAPIIKFKSERKDFVSRIVYQTPELLDLLEAELVFGQGSIAAVFDVARNEMEGDLRLIMNQVHKFIQTEQGNIRKSLELLKVRINHKLYDQIVLALQQYMVTAQAESIIEKLHRLADGNIREQIKKQTTQRNMTIAVVAIGILVNLVLLAGVPILLGIFDTTKAW